MYGGSVTMKMDDFNVESKVPRYAYERSPVQDRAFMIVRADEKGINSAPVGDYTVLDPEEDLELAEKKVMNLISLLNGRKKLMDLGHETKTRVLYRIVSERDDENKSKILFYNLGNEGVSVENALFRIEADEEIWDA
tara:strand:- start:455 stop:865 length:411 start_codon:yes stop_codon:yes gene_type:complete